MNEYTYAEAIQLTVEQSKSKWNHTAMIAFYICEVQRDPKKGKKLKPQDFNPWMSKSSGPGTRLDFKSVHMMKGMARNGK